MPIEKLRKMKLRVCVIFALFTLNLSFMQIPDGVCPSDLSNCLLGDDHALKCYQSVEKIRVSAAKD